MLCASPTSAFFFPHRRTSRRYFADRYVPFVRVAAQAACTSALRSQALPFVVRPLLRLPALSLLPGHKPAHEASCCCVANRPMSVPTSATTTSATRRLIPGIVINSHSAAHRPGGSFGDSDAAAVSGPLPPTAGFESPPPGGGGGVGGRSFSIWAAIRCSS